MRLISGVDFDPVCPSILYVHNGQTVPSPTGMTSHPCLEPNTAASCCCSCWRVDFPGFIDIAGSATDGTNCYVTPDPVTIIIADDSGSACNGLGALGCTWNACIGQPTNNVLSYSNWAGTDGSAFDITLVLTLAWPVITGVLTPQPTVTATYKLHGITCAGGMMQLVSTQAVTQGSCAGVSAKWPLEVLLTGFPCHPAQLVAPPEPTPCCRNCFQIDGHVFTFTGFASGFQCAWFDATPSLDPPVSSIVTSGCYWGNVTVTLQPESQVYEGMFSCDGFTIYNLDSSGMSGPVSRTVIPIPCS